ncbi:hypothetical protein [Streptomyces sp. MI02-7b]|uniref:hypothetical protein n=1 Tax=Streptomyces sp. MI02-7b TaxID=462941 RepID=UPI0029A0F57C|nr:hypothetical protein [Streptomyces sp. MI02-7b]MDX3078396.1 hypothetical protein [Streptomyces sp. MI02-7b]
MAIGALIVAAVAGIAASGALANHPDGEGHRPGAGASPIAVRADAGGSQCPTVWFDGTPKQYIAQLQPGLKPPKNAIDLSGPTYITVQGNTNRSVLLMSMDVTVTAKSTKPVGGIVVTSGECGGGVSERYFDVDLSKTPPVLTAKPETAEFSDKVVKPAVTFPFKVAEDDPEVFSLHLKGRPNGGCTDCGYSVVLHWVAAGKKGTTTVGGYDNGFRLMDTSKLPAYHLEYATLPGGSPKLMPLR